jgi:hypothetical protein
MLPLHRCTMDVTLGMTSHGILPMPGSASVLTIDFRGFGESGGDKLLFGELSRTVIPQKFPGDVEAAYAFLRAQSVDPSRVTGGASCGVTQSSSWLRATLRSERSSSRPGTASDETSAYIVKTPALAIFWHVGGGGSACRSRDQGSAQSVEEPEIDAEDLRGS